MMPAPASQPQEAGRMFGSIRYRLMDVREWHQLQESMQKMHPEAIYSVGLNIQLFYGQLWIEEHGRD